MENKIRVVIADDEPIIRMDLREFLEEEGFDVIGEVSDGFDAIEVCKNLKPDVVLMDINMPLLDGNSAAKVIFEEGYCETIIILSVYNEREFLDKSKQTGASGYLVKPIDEKSLLTTIEIAFERGLQSKKIKKDLFKVNEKLENRKIIEKAKGVVMEDQGTSENNAYEYIRKLSQTKQMSMKKVAELILIKNEV
ncbi:MAG: ANTAR domain-containing response regulator [Oscillospiraceae bacterium]